jgi:hypothetical protein
MNTIELLKIFVPLPDIRESDKVLFVSQANGRGVEAYIQREIKILEDNIGEPK